MQKAERRRQMADEPGTRGQGSGARAGLSSVRRGRDQESRLPITVYRLPPTAYRLPRRAFTLVEMLVVITIIGILAGLITVGAYSAIEAAKKVRIKTEMGQLHAALEAYKAKYGDYPPSILGKYRPSVGSSLDVDLDEPRHPVYRHLAKAFPRCNPVEEVKYIPRADGGFAASTTYPYNANSLPMNPAQALVFWLTSISKDPARPLSALTIDRQSFFDFDKSRFFTALNRPTGWDIITEGSLNIPRYTPGVYMPQDGHGAPYVYFDARTYFDHNLNFGGTNDPPAYLTRSDLRLTSPMTNPAPGEGTCGPYVSDLFDKNGNGRLDNVEWHKNNPPASMDREEFQALCSNPKSFQIICAGLDGNFGNWGVQLGYEGSMPPQQYFKIKSYPSGAGYNAEDDDNLTNFSEKALGDAKP